MNLGWVPLFRKEGLAQVVPEAQMGQGLDPLVRRAEGVLMGPQGIGQLIFNLKVNGGRYHGQDKQGIGVHPVATGLVHLATRAIGPVAIDLVQ